MKILHIIGTLSGGGAERLVAQLAPLMNDGGNTCVVLILSDQDGIYIERLREIGVTVQVSPYKNRYDLRIAPYISRLIKREAYNIVHAHTFPSIYWVSIAARLFGRNTKIIMTEHNTYNRRRDMPWLKSLERFIYRRYDAVISISAQTQTKLLQWIKPRDVQKYVTVENGIDVQMFKQAQSLSRCELGIDEDVYLLGIVGSFTEQKNHATFIHALALLKKDVHAVFAGTGPLLDETVSLVQSLGLTERVHFLGFRRDIERIMKTVDAIVIPSRWEGFGLIAVEAMACGKPIAAANVPGLREVVGDCAALFDPTNHDDIANVLKTLLDDEARQTDYAARGLVRAEYFSIEKMAAIYLDIYSRLREGMTA